MHSNEKPKLKALTDIASIDITLEFNEILKKILKSTCETIKANSGTMMLVDESGGDDIRMVASYGLPDNYIDMVYEAAEKAGISLISGPSGAVLETGEYYLVPNVYEEPKVKPWLHLCDELGFSSQIFTPMKRGLKVIGMLNVYWEKPRKFTDEEINFVSIAASQASSLIQNAKMCTRLKKNINELDEYKNHLEEKVRETNKQLYDSELYLRAIIDSSFDVIFVLDDKGKVEFGNEPFFKIHDWSKEKLIGKVFVDFFPDDTKDLMLERWHEMQNGIKTPFETKIKTNSCNTRYLYVSHSKTEIKGATKYVVIIKDISDYKKLELDLKESEQYLNTIISSSFDGIFVVDTEGRFEYGNDAFARILGWPKDELIGEGFMKVIHEDMHEFMLGKWDEIQKGIEIPYETKIITKNGEIRYLHVSHARTEINNVDKYVAIIKDISQFKKLELDIQESEKRYRELFENAHDIMYVHDAEGIILKMNAIATKLMGCSSNDEIIGTNFSQWLTPESVEYAQKTLIQHISGQPVKQPIVLEVICKNGEHKWAEIKNRPIIKDGKLIEVHGIARDITKRKKLEQSLLESHHELQKSEGKYRELFENANDGIYTHDGKGFITDMNHVGLDILGCNREEVIGEHISKWLTPESMKLAEDALIKTITDEKIQIPLLIEIVRNYGEHRWLEFNSRPVFKDSEFEGITGVFRDITDKVRMEHQLKQYHEQLQESYEKLKETDELKTDFISNITHELMTPMTAIRGFTELIKDETLGSINDEQEKSLDTIYRNSNRLIHLIEQLLNVTNLEKNLMKLHKEAVSMNDIISKVVEDVKPQADAKRITVIESTVPLPEITGDKEKLYEVIINLLVNAVKFTPNNGKIIINSEDDGDNIHISVKDTGIGIPADKLSRIFDRFYQVDGSDSRKYGGTGIGLSLCKGIVEKHNGSIHAESDEKGSTFHVMLPKKQD